MFVALGRIRAGIAFLGWLAAVARLLRKTLPSACAVRNLLEERGLVLDPGAAAGWSKPPERPKRQGRGPFIPLAEGVEYFP